MEEESGKGKILLVDDTPSTVSMVRTALESEGYEVLVATSGEKALKRAELAKPDLILLDILMPGMDGYETCRHLKSRGTTRDIPVIFMSALTGAFDKVKGFNLGAVDYVTKPVETEELLSRVDTHLTVRRLQEKLLKSQARLEEKVLARTEDLRKSNLRLEEEISERKRAEEALRKAHDELESRIGERTAELAAANESLRNEITDRKKAEEALRESEELHRITIENISDPVFITNDRGRFTFICANILHILGYTVQEVQAMGNVAKLLGEGLFTLEELEARGEIRGIEGVIEDKQGRVRSYLITVKRVFIKGGTILYTCHDITERKKAEDAIRKSEEEYRLLLNNTPAGIFSTDTRGRILEVNRSLLQMLSSPSAEATQEINVLTFPPLVQTGLVDLMKSCMKEGRTQVFEGPYTSKWGKHAHWRVILTPTLSETGIVTGCQALVEDITERKEAELALRESEEKYRCLFEESTDAIVVVHPDGRLLAANPACSRLLGACKEEIIGASILEFYWDPADGEGFLAEMLQKGTVREFDWKVRRRDGLERDCLVNSSVWKDQSGSIIGYLGIVRDVTASKRLEEQLRQAQKMESLGTMASGVAHDFNNLLTIILGYSELLLASKTEEDGDYQDLRRIFSTAERGGDLVRSILMFSRKVESSPRPIDLNHEVKRSKKLLERTIPKMIAIDLHLADDLKRVHADSAQIEQALLNLAVNAQHAMPEGGTLTLATQNVTLDEEYCRTHLEAEPGEYVLLSVSDTGHGMEKGVLEHIFEPFYTTKEAGEGTGLGLAMVYGIITGHGGRISCYSEPGHGTTFKTYLPAIEQETGSIEAAREEMIKGGTETVLLVDDEEHIRALGKRILSQAGYGILTAENGQKALEVYGSQRDRISLVILDLIMPQMGGKEFLEELLKIDPGARVLVASGFSPNGPTKASVQAGAKGFVGKPFKVTELLRMVRKVLDEA